MSRRFDALIKAETTANAQKRRANQKSRGVNFSALSVFKDKRRPIKIDFDLDPYVEEQYQKLRLHLLPNSKRAAVKVVMVAATDHGEGGTTTAAILASTLARSGNAKILLIDDEVDDLFVLEKFLIHAGFEVKSFSSPREALRHYTNEDPYSYDLVISDIRMPEINGFQLYHKLRLINDNVKIVFATCLEIVDEILTLIPELGQEQLIQKPVEKEKFIKIVRKNIS